MVREQGVDFTDTGVRYMLGNRTYFGEVRSGELVKESAHPALVTSSLFRRRQSRGVKSQRTGRLEGRYLRGRLARCANCGYGLRLSTGGNDHRRSTTADTGTARSGGTRGLPTSTLSC